VSLACEVGAGRSILCEILAGRGRDIGGVVLVDSSMTMLEHSSRWIESGAVMICGDARQLPIPTAALAVLVVSLGDPFNDESFWREASRVLSAGAEAWVTLPAWEWAHPFRQIEDLADRDSAVFRLASGELVRVPSFVLSDRAQREIFKANGLAVLSVHDVRLSDLGEADISPKLLTATAQPDPAIVTGYALVKEVRRRPPVRESIGSEA
jgi:hypothetical protein